MRQSFMYPYLAVAALVTVAQQAVVVKKRVPAKRIGTYMLIRMLASSHKHHGVSVGVYRKKGKMYLIKTWCGRWKNLKYYSLLGEFFATKTLFDAEKRGGHLPVTQTITFSKPVHIIKNKQGFSTIYEFAEGALLSTFPLHRQERVLHGLIKYLKERTLLLLPHERKMISARGHIFYGVSLPYIFILSLFTRKQPFFTTVSVFLRGILTLVKLTNASLVLSHRDIDTNHIIVGRKTISLVDCEHMVLTYEGYDTTLISMRYPKFSQFTSHPFFMQYLYLFTPIR